MKEFIIFDKTESVLESVAKDTVTFAFLLLCMWYSYSQGGGWWTFLTCSIFLFCIAVRIPFIEKKRKSVLKSKADAITWANSLDDDSSV